MFVKLTKSGPRSYVLLVEAYLDDAGRSKQRTVATLGRLDQMGDWGGRQFGALILKKVHVFNSLSIS
jgi:hypothetical protein